MTGGRVADSTDREKFATNVSLLATVPREKRCAGKVTVQAAYRF